MNAKLLTNPGKMLYDVNSYEVFLNGKLNPIAHTKFDSEARKAEKRFAHQLMTFEDPPMFFLKIKVAELKTNPNLLIEKLEKLDVMQFGFKEGEKIDVSLDPEEIDEEGNIEVLVKSGEKYEFPSLDSKKTEFFEKERKKISEGIIRDLKQTTLAFETDERVNTFIIQQYQFAHYFLERINQRRRFTEEHGESMNKVSTNKKPTETNGHILMMIESDLLQVIKFIEGNYPFYLKGKIIEKKQKSSAQKNKTGRLRKLFSIDNWELKPNFAGIGINLNEILKNLLNKES
jgi:hypothetical protein